MHNIWIKQVNKSIFSIKFYIVQSFSSATDIQFIWLVFLYRVISSSNVIVITLRPQGFL